MQVHPPPQGRVGPHGAPGSTLPPLLSPHASAVEQPKSTIQQADPQPGGVDGACFHPGTFPEYTSLADGASPRRTMWVMLRMHRMQ